jgi:transposase
MDRTSPPSARLPQLRRRAAAAARVPAQPADRVEEGRPGAVSRKDLEHRRIQAGELLLQGLRQSEVADRLRVSRETVRRWAGKMGEGGLAALKNAPRLGRPAGLDTAQRQQLGLLLQQGGMAHGFVGNDWSLSRVRQLIARHFGRSYSEVQVWRILGALGWSHQQPGAGGHGSKRRKTREWIQKR